MIRSKQSGLLLPTAMLLAMFSLVAATIVMARSKQSLQLTRLGEQVQQRRLTAKAELNHLLAELSQGASLEEMTEEVREVVSEDGTSKRSWVVPDADNPGILHLHAEVWRTDVGPPGERVTKVVRAEGEEKQVHFLQTSQGLRDFKFFYREDGEANWNQIPTDFDTDSTRDHFFESYDADDAGGVYVVEVYRTDLDDEGADYTFRRFDPETSAWTTLASPGGDGKLTSLSSQSGQVAALTRSGEDTFYDQVSTYDATTDTWTTLPPPPNQLYDQNGVLNTATSGRIQGSDIDIDGAGNIYFRAMMKMDTVIEGDYQATIHKWDGASWSTLPPPPPSILPPGLHASDQRVGYVNKKLAATGDGQVALAWGSHRWGDQPVQRLLEFDGTNWTSHPIPTSGMMYGDDYATRAGLDPTEQTPFLTSVSSNLDGQIYVSNTFNTATLEESTYTQVDEPPTDSDISSSYNIASGTKPTAGTESFETVVSF